MMSLEIIVCKTCVNGSGKMSGTVLFWVEPCLESFILEDAAFLTAVKTSQTNLGRFYEALREAVAPQRD